MIPYNSSVRLFLLVTVISFCLSFTANAQKSWKLDVSGNVRDEDSKAAMKGAKLEITKGGAVYKTIYADDNGNFSYSLDPDNTYTVKVSYGNYVSKIITISTENTPSDEEVKQNFKANTEFRIFKRVEDVDYSVLDGPIGSIFFDATENKFDYNVVDFDLKKKLEELKKEMEKKKAEKEAQEKAEREAALKRAAFTKDSLAKAELDAKKKAIKEAEDAKKQAAAAAKAEAEAKKQAAAEAEAAKKKAAADAEAALAEEKKKAAEAAEASKLEAKKKQEQEAQEKLEAKKKAEQAEADKLAQQKKAEQEELDKAAEKKKADLAAQEQAKAEKKKQEQEALEKAAAAKKAAEDEQKKKATPPTPKPEPVKTVKQEVHVAPPVKPIESAPPEIIHPESVRYDEFDYGTYHVNRTFVTIGGVEIEYQKIKHQWGGIFYKRDGLDITDVTYRKEMRKYGLDSK